MDDRDLGNDRGTPEMAEPRSLPTYSRVSLGGMLEPGAMPIDAPRDLAEDESAELWSELKTIWGVEPERYSFWYPLDGPDRTDLLAIEAVPFLADTSIDGLRDVLQARGVTSVFELQLWPVNRPDRELPLSQWTIVSDSLEYYWFSKSLDWIVYSSHEESITIGGRRLQAALKEMWPTWRSHLWPTQRPP